MLILSGFAEGIAEIDRRRAGNWMFLEGPKFLVDSKFLALKIERNKF